MSAQLICALPCLCSHAYLLCAAEPACSGNALRSDTAPVPRPVTATRAQLSLSLSRSLQLSALCSGFALAHRSKDTTAFQRSHARLYSSPLRTGRAAQSIRQAAQNHLSRPHQFAGQAYTALRHIAAILTAFRQQQPSGIRLLQARHQLRHTNIYTSLDVFLSKHKHKRKMIMRSIDTSIC